jgi:peptidoglycan-associated lipoprotein
MRIPNVAKLATALSAVVLLAACSSTPTTTANTGGAGMNTGAQTAPVAPVTQYPPGSEEQLKNEVGDRVFFDFDKYDLSAEARAQLEKQAAWLKTYPQITVLVAGNCDERGTREYNLALGERRATAAKNYLVALGVDANRIQTISYGKERPSVLGSDEAAWAQNRNAITSIQGAAGS